MKKCPRGLEQGKRLFVENRSTEIHRIFVYSRFTKSASPSPKYFSLTPPLVHKKTMAQHSRHRLTARPR
jgi:hypothetical protein